nr:hypothetical protein [Tanacetum cinerariifolium]
MDSRRLTPDVLQPVIQVPRQQQFMPRPRAGGVQQRADAGQRMRRAGARRTHQVAGQQHSVELLVLHVFDLRQLEDGATLAAEARPSYEPFFDVAGVQLNQRVEDVSHLPPGANRLSHEPLTNRAAMARGLAAQLLKLVTQRDHRLGAAVQDLHHRR